MAKKIERYEELRVFTASFDAAMEIFRLSKDFPREEKYSLTDQIRRSSRSVCTNIAEAWRKRRYPAAFVAKLSDAETEAAETHVWLRFCGSCGYLDEAEVRRLCDLYDKVQAQLVLMIQTPDKWMIR